MEPTVKEIVEKAEQRELLQSLEISSSTDPELQKELAKSEYAHGTLGLIFGGICIVLGVVLCLTGVVGTTNWTAKTVGLESNISDATPGVLLFIIGIFIIYITKPQFRHK